ADAPVVEVLGPRVHLPARDLLRVVEHRGEQPRLVPAALPELPGECVVLAVLLGELQHRADWDAERSRRHDPVAKQAVLVTATTLLLEPNEDFVLGHGPWITVASPCCRSGGQRSA